MEVCNKNYSYNAPNFCGYRTKLGKRLDEVIKKGLSSVDDNMFFRLELNKLIKKRRAQAQDLGEGTQSIVYKIDDKYVVKVPLNTYGYISGNLVVCKQQFSHLKTYFGEPVAQIGNIKILRNASSEGRAVPAGIPKHLPEEFDKFDLNSYYSNFYLPLFANVPQRSYNALAFDIKTLSKMCNPSDNSKYTFDYFNPNNVVLSGNTLKMTDEVESTNRFDKNTISDMLNVFLKQMTVGIPATPSERLTPFRVEIAKKIIKAGMKHGLSLCDNNMPSLCWNYTLKYLCRAKESPDVILRRLINIKESATNPNEIQCMTDKYLNELFS